MKSILTNKMRLFTSILFALTVMNFTTAVGQCGCNFIISLSGAEWKFDGAVKGVKPGDKICITSGTRKSIYFDNINGTAAKPVIVTNMCDGKVTIKELSTASYGIEFHRSSFFKFTGAGNPAEKQGITIDGGYQALDLKELSTNFEVDHLKILNAGYAGVMAKTDPTCDPKTWRGNFTMRDVSLHDLEISTLGGEGFYVGNSHYETTVSRVCGGNNIQVEEHEVIGLKLYNCNLHDIGRDGIQVGSVTSDCTIHHNTVYNFGTTGEYAQGSGLQINPGTNTECYNNVVNKGTQWGVFLGGRGGSRLYNNLIMNCLVGGIICQDAIPYDPTGFTITNNTLVNNVDYGIYMFSQHTVQNLFANNIIIATTSPTFQYVRLNYAPAQKWTDVNNIKTTSVAALKFVNPDPSSPTYDFHLQAGSSAIDAGKDLTSYGFNFDLNDKPKPQNAKFDIGAYEFQVGGPTSNAGIDKILTLPTNAVTINGIGSSVLPITYAWVQKSGVAATLSNVNTANLSVSGLLQGIYVFELQVTDAVGTAFDAVQVTVNPAAVNQPPVANAGLDIVLLHPTSSAIINGKGTDADGTVTTYSWTQTGGTPTTLTNANTKDLQVDGLGQGTFKFLLTVTDNLLATGSDEVVVTVSPPNTNLIPIVNAGLQQSIFVPTSTITLTATASDPDGTIATILWEKKSGGTVTLGTTDALVFNPTGLVQGSYTFRVTVTDNQGATNFSEVIVNVLSANQSPTANAGIDQQLTLPTNATTVFGTGNDPDGSISTYLWSKVSGPATGNLSGTNTATLTLSNLVQGTYIFGLTVTDNDSAIGYDEVIVAISPSAVGPNEIPIANSGGNIAFPLPTNSTNLYGSGFDPDGTIVTYSWVLVSGGAVTIANANTPTLSISDLVAGQYTFKLTVTDDKGATDEDVAIITVSSQGTNVAPVAFAGVDKIVKLPSSATLLVGTGTDSDGLISAYEWSQIGGAASTISSPTNASTNIFGLALGNYQYRLLVTDDQGATNFSDITVRVVASTNNEPPLVNAGADAKVFLPQTTYTFNAMASDDGTIISYNWIKLSGPTVNLVNPAQLNLDVTNLVQGNYQFQLTVTDNLGASVFDVVLLNVVPATFAAPTVDAGLDQEITLPLDHVSLSGTASSPNGAISTVGWIQLSGPAATLSPLNQANLDVTNMPAGTYVFTFGAKDSNNNQASDNVTVLVNVIPTNLAPFTNAGPNQVIKIPASQVTLLGSATDSDGTVVSTVWTQTQGPNTATLTDATTLNATASNLIVGNYVFKLTAKDDKNALGSATASVSVAEPNPPKALPTVYAGGSVTLTLPENDTTIVAEAASPNGFIELFLWKQISGAPVSFNDQGTFISFKDLNPGRYQFELTVIDSDTISASDVLNLAVIEKQDEIPKFFSPNNDGYGEYWVFRNVDAYQQCKLMVYSRSGQIVFDASPYKNNWNGTYNGKPLGEGDYYYSIKCDSGRELTGAVRIIR